MVNVWGDDEPARVIEGDQLFHGLVVPHEKTRPAQQAWIEPVFQRLTAEAVGLADLDHAGLNPFPTFRVPSAVLWRELRRRSFPRGR